MTARELAARLAAGDIVPLGEREWARLAAGFEVVERHNTGVAGELLIARGTSGLCAVERPDRDRRVVRPLADAASAAAFVAARLAAYERAWDG